MGRTGGNTAWLRLDPVRPPPWIPRYRALDQISNAYLIQFLPYVHKDRSLIFFFFVQIEGQSKSKPCHPHGIDLQDVTEYLLLISCGRHLVLNLHAPGFL